MSEEPVIISDGDIVREIVDAIDADEPKTLGTILGKIKEKSFLIDNSGKTNLFSLCYQNNAIDCLRLVAKTGYNAGVKEFLQEIISDLNKSEAGSSKLFMGSFLYADIYKPGIFEVAKAELRKLHDSHGLIDTFFRFDTNVSSILMKADITVLIKDLLESNKSSTYYYPARYRTIFELLLSKKQDISEFDAEYHLIHKAITSEIPFLSEKSLRFMLRNNCDPNQQGKYCVLMDLVNMFFINPKLYEVLIKAGCDVNAVNAANETALIRIFRLWNKEIPKQDIVKLFIDNGADTSIVDIYGHDAKYYGMT